MNDNGDPVWDALEGLRHSAVINDARGYAAARAARNARVAAWRDALGWLWPRGALAGALALVAFFLAPPRGGVIETDVGEIRRAKLADGSVVMLNTSSRLRVRFREGSREVELLAGQARFDVAHDASRPFRVTANGLTVTAIGTAFDVTALPRRTMVTLIEGKVLVEANAAGRSPLARRLLAPGQQVRLAAGALTRPDAARMDAALAWQRQLVDFSDMSLAQALEEVNRYSEVKVVVADPTLGGEQVSGVFRAGDVEAVAAALGAYFDLAVVRRDENEIVLNRLERGTASGGPI